MLYQRRMRLPHVEDPTLNGVPLERMMLSLSSDGVTIDAAKPTLSMQDMPGRDGRLDLTLTDPTGAAYMGDRAITLSLYAIGGNYRCPDAAAHFPDFYDNVVLTASFANGMQG